MQGIARKKFLIRATITSFQFTYSWEGENPFCVQKGVFRPLHGHPLPLSSKNFNSGTVAFKKVCFFL